MQVREFGDSVLRGSAELVDVGQLAEAETQEMIVAMRDLLITKHAGVALAAPQVGVAKQIVVIAVRATEHRPHVDEVDLVMINPEITQTFGRKLQMWEGCLSAGKSGLFAKTPRYSKVEVTYMDEHGKPHRKTFDGLLAQITQHEIDHLEGTLFVDRVKDTTTYMTKSQYIRMLKSQSEGK